MKNVDSKAPKAGNLDHWKRIVEAIWSLNHINAGIRSMMPRAASAPENLHALKALIPSLETSAAAVLERELRTMTSEVAEAAELLETQKQEMRALLSLIEEKREQVDHR